MQPVRRRAGTAVRLLRTIGLIWRSWPFAPSSPVRGGDDTGVPSVLTSADGGILRGLKASEPWTEPAQGEVSSQHTDGVDGESANT